IWEVYNAGDDPATATPVSTGTFAAGITQGIADGLTPETDYDLYLISDCGPDGQSDLTNPISFTTTELCSLPSTFEVVNLQPDSAELNWSSIPNATNGYSWAVFNAGDDPATATPVDSGVAGSGDTSAIATGLTDNTPYDAYITTDCGADGQSDQSLPVSFTTPCNVFSAPITEDFESASWVPGTGFGNTGDAIDDCWSRDPESPDYFWGTRTGTTGSTGTGPDSANSGANYVFTESSNGSLGDEAFLVSPLIDLSPLSDPALSFWYHMFGGDIGTINVDVNAGSGYDLAVFTLSGQQQTAGNEPWIEQFVDLSAYAGQTVQIRFRAVLGDGFGGDIAIDDFKVDEAPSCLTPTGLTVTNITENTADLSWNAIGNASAGYNWFIFNAGDDPAVDPPVASGSTAAGVTSDNVTGLPSSSFLEAYIQANCGTADGLSELSPAVSFETLCDVFPTPYFEDFENFTVSTTFDEDGCWDEDSSGNFTWDVGTGDTVSADTGPDAAFSGANYLFTEASSGLLGDEAIVLSPEVDLSSLSTPALSFRYHMYGAEIDQLSIDIDDGSTLDLDVLTIVGEQQSSETDDWIQTFVDLSPYVGQTIQVRFRVTRGDGFAGDIAIDDVNFDEAPTCFDPLNLEVLSVSDTTADLNWQPGSSETNFDVEVVLAGTTPTGVPTFEDVSVPFTATGLNSETDYDFYVRADCGPGDVSNWVGPESFTTAITPVSVIVNDPAINNTYCYDNNEFKEWLFVSSDGTTAVEVVFNGGTIEDGFGSTDRFRVFDGFDDNAPVLYDSDVDGTDLSGVSLTANSGAAYMLLESDIFGSCQNGVDVEVPFDFDVFAGTMSTVAFSEDYFKYYPNPVESILNIDSANPIESVQVFDILGKEVFSQDYENLSVNINMNALSSGTYLMKVSISGNSQTFRVIKE
ncbi:MAG: choice-of-anchor J domain-containing protein, partial [Psychroflexus sp.]|nr:choice-of-anchor J domain-containing protein [Psychroflexus sp.]